MVTELPNISGEWIDKIFLPSEDNFLETALQIFQYQYQYNPVYAQYANAVGKNPGNVLSLADIPFLPISCFKTHPVTTGYFIPQAIFESSGTTGSINSRHLVRNISIYKESFLKAFELFYGSPAGYCIIGLLPSYLERKHSSLVLMVDELIKQSSHPHAGFYLYEHEKLASLLNDLEMQQQKSLLIGVTFALLDFAEAFPMPLQHTIVMETGGMKGRREEWTRLQVHDYLSQQWGITVVHSEYGMTELLSQAYSTGNGIFRSPSWMKIVLRNDDDPLSISTSGTGVINVIDLANIYSCSFIATGDVGKLYEDGSFEVLGRLDNADLRGCSLLTL